MNCKANTSNIAYSLPTESFLSVLGRDEAVCIGPAPNLSYLKKCQNIIAAAEIKWYFGHTLVIWLFLSESVEICQETRHQIYWCFSRK
jgi:biotin carboxylase